MIGMEVTHRSSPSRQQYPRTRSDSVSSMGSYGSCGEEYSDLSADDLSVDDSSRDVEFTIPHLMSPEVVPSTPRIHLSCRSSYESLTSLLSYSASPLVPEDPPPPLPSLLPAMTVQEIDVPLRAAPQSLRDRLSRRQHRDRRGGLGMLMRAERDRPLPFLDTGKRGLFWNNRRVRPVMAIKPKVPRPRHRRDSFNSLPRPSELRIHDDDLAIVFGACEKTVGRLRARPLWQTR